MVENLNNHIVTMQVSWCAENVQIKRTDLFLISQICADIFDVMQQLI